LFAHTGSAEPRPARRSPGETAARRRGGATQVGLASSAAPILVIVLTAAQALAAPVSFSVRMGDEVRTADVQVFYRSSVPHIALNYLVRQLGGGCRVSPDRLQVDLAAQSAWLRPNETHVNASLESFNLAHPVIRQGGDVLIALSDAAPFFRKAFRLELQQKAPVATPPTLPAEEDTEMILSPLEPLAAPGPPAEQTPPPEPPSDDEMAPELHVEELTPLSTEEAEPERPNEALRTVGRDIRVVILDAGHGGSDTGCVGSGGLRECDLSLALAVRLKEAMEKGGRVEVLLTRDSDRLLTRHERVSLANSNQGDLLLSLHAGAAFSPQAHGFEIYCCQEGQDQPAGGPPSVGSAYAARSRVVAGHVAAALAEGTETEARGVRQLRCHLLTDLAMPGLLIEVGFLTNPSEEAMLQTEAYQTALAEAIATGVERRLAGAAPEGGAP